MCLNVTVVLPTVTGSDYNLLLYFHMGYGCAIIYVYTYGKVEADETEA